MGWQTSKSCTNKKTGNTHTTTDMHTRCDGQRLRKSLEAGNDHTHTQLDTEAPADWNHTSTAAHSPPPLLLLLALVPAPRPRQRKLLLLPAGPCAAGDRAGHAQPLRPRQAPVGGSPPLGIKGAGVLDPPLEPLLGVKLAVGRALAGDDALLFCNGLVWFRGWLLDRQPAG